MHLFSRKSRLLAEAKRLQRAYQSCADCGSYDVHVASCFDWIVAYLEGRAAIKPKPFVNSLLTQCTENIEDSERYVKIVWVKTLCDFFKLA